MKFRWDKKYLYWGVTGFAVICASLLFYFGLFHMDVLWGKVHNLFTFLHSNAIIQKNFREAGCVGFTYPLFLSLYCIITLKEGNCHVTQAAPYVKKSVQGFPDSVRKRPVFPCDRRLYPAIRHHHRRHDRSGPRICALVPHADHSVRTVLQYP